MNYALVVIILITRGLLDLGVDLIFSSNWLLSIGKPHDRMIQSKQACYLVTISTDIEMKELKTLQTAAATVSSRIRSTYNKSTQCPQFARTFQLLFSQARSYPQSVCTIHGHNCYEQQQFSTAKEFFVVNNDNSGIAHWNFIFIFSSLAITAAGCHPIETIVRPNDSK